MAGFLRKTSDDSGSVLWTSARDDGTGKPITDVEIKGTPSVQLSGSNVLDGQKNVTTAGTAVQLNPDTPSRSVLIRAKSTNTGIIKVGSTSTPLYPLYADEGVSLQVSNLNKIYVDAEINGEGVVYFAEV